MILTDRICYTNKFQQDAKRIRKVYKEYEPNNKYKTEICKKWIEGLCKYGDSCIFAHGNQELKSNFVHKIKECQNFKDHFWCPYGEKCQFIHNHTTKKTRLPVFAKILLRSTSEN